MRIFFPSKLAELKPVVHGYMKLCLPLEVHSWDCSKPSHQESSLQQPGEFSLSAISRNNRIV